MNRSAAEGSNQAGATPSLAETWASANGQFTARVGSSQRIARSQLSRTVVPRDDDAGSLGDWATRHGLLMEETAESIRAKGRTVLLEQPIAITSRTGVAVSGSMDIWVEEDAAAKQAGTGSANTGRWMANVESTGHLRSAQFCYSAYADGRAQQ